LEAPIYSVTYQTKMVWVGICSVVLLGRKLFVRQWVALAMTMVGVATVQLSSKAPEKEEGKPTGVVHSVGGQTFGILVLLTAALFSALAGVSFEKLLKGSTASLWERNLQLAGFSVLSGLFTLVCSNDYHRVTTEGFLNGYTPLTWLCVSMNAFGGLVVGMAIKYADAIVKDLALGVSICVAAAGSVYCFGFQPTPNFFVGVITVSYGASLYAGNSNCFGFLADPSASAPPPPKPKPVELELGKPNETAAE
jgi:UDP-sugar transporter A1/2/3